MATITSEQIDELEGRELESAVWRLVDNPTGYFDPNDIGAALGLCMETGFKLWLMYFPGVECSWKAELVQPSPYIVFEACGTIAAETLLRCWLKWHQEQT